jgi:BirA family transcriptional regulator, biotin operon repressor / biotin---[acetyl-CoA-carboxylase] ligase
MLNNDILSSEALTDELHTKFIGRKIVCYESVTSTNDVAKIMALDKAVDGTLVITQEQTAGKGRLGRVWTSPKGTLALSLILRPDVFRLNSLIMIASLAVLRTLQKMTVFEPKIKWPNDILINDKKVCGILIENGWRGSTLDYAIVGIGINVNFNPEDYPDIKDTATSLSNESGKIISVLKLTRQLLEEFEKLYLDGDIIFEEWRNNLVTLGKEVRVTSGIEVNEGVAESVERDGSLLLRLPEGKLLKIAAGDVTLRR